MDRLSDRGGELVHAAASPGRLPGRDGDGQRLVPSTDRDDDIARRGQRRGGDVEKQGTGRCRGRCGRSPGALFCCQHGSDAVGFYLNGGFRNLLSG